MQSHHKKCHEKSDHQKCGGCHDHHHKSSKNKTIQGNLKVKHNLTVCKSVQVKKNLEVCGDASVKGGLVVCGEIPLDKRRKQKYQFTGVISNPILPVPGPGFPPSLPDTSPPNVVVHEFDINFIGTLTVNLSWTPWTLASNDPDLDLFLYEPGSEIPLDAVDWRAKRGTDAVHDFEGAGNSNPEIVEFPITKTGKWKAQIEYHEGTVEANYTLDVKAVEEVRGLEVKSFLDLSQAAVIPDQHPCVGWWAQVTKANSFVNFLIEIKRAPNSQLYGVMYYGSQAGEYREDTWYNISVPANFDITEKSPTELFLHFDVPKPPFLFWTYNSQGDSFIVNPNNHKVAHSFFETVKIKDADEAEFPGFGFALYQKYIKLPGRPNIKEFDSYNDCTDPQKIFEWFFQQTQLETGTQMNTEVRATGLNPDWPGFAKVNQVKNQLLKEPREYISHVNGDNGSTVWPTLKKTVDLADLGPDPFKVLKPYKITAPSIPVAGIIETAAFGSRGLIAVYDPNASTDLLGMAVNISGATGFAEQRIPEERINTNTFVAFVSPGVFWLGFNFDIPLSWGQNVFGGGNDITITPLSAIVNIPNHGLKFTDLIEIEGAESFNGIAEEELNSTFVVSYVTDTDNIIINFSPDINITSDGVGGGNNVSVEKWTIPVNPTAAPRMFDPTTTLLPVTKYTTIITDKFNGYHVGAKIVVEGFTGDYSIVNGEWRTSPFYNNAGSRCRPLEEVYLDTFYNPETDKNYNFISIPLDTSGLSVYDSEKHGKATIRVSYGPVTSDMGYYDLIGSCAELFGQSVIGTHSNFLLGTGNFSRNLLTWEDANKFASFGTGFFGDIFGTRTRNAQDTIGNNVMPGFSLIPNDLPPNSIIGVNSIDQTKRWDPSDPKYQYTISRSNYLDPNTVHNFYLRVNPNTTPDPDPLHISNYLTLFGYNHNGVCAPEGEYALEFKIVSFNSTGSPPDFDPYVSNVNRTDSFVPGYKLVGVNKDTLYFGLVKDELTNGIKTGYMRAGNTVLSDKPLNLIAQTGWSNKGEIAAFNNHRRMFALMMKYFSDNNVEKIILDIRVNTGGIVPNIFSLSSFFGGNRPGYDTAYTPIGNGNSDMIVLEKLLDDGVKPIQTNYQIYETITKEVPTNDTAETVFSDFEGGTFLGSEVMFRGPDKKCVVLNSTNSFSGGDVFPHFFRGTSEYPNDLGSDNSDPNRCQSIFVGGADSRLAGGSSGFGHNPINLTSNLKSTPSLVDNEPYPAMLVLGECFNNRIDREKGEYYANQLEKMGWVPGKDVGPLNCSFDNAWWQDIGLADLGEYFDGTPRNTAPWTSLPNSGIPENGSPRDGGATRDTWRDYALEESIRS